MLNAPVDCCCNFSKISCSSLGNLGGEGPGLNGDDESAVRVEKARGKKPGRRVRTLLIDCMLYCAYNVEEAAFKYIFKVEMYVPSTCL